MKKMDDQFNLGNMGVRNRLVLPPLTTNYGTKEGRVTPEILRFYRARSGHVGIGIVEAAAVSPDGRIVPGSLGLWEDEQIPGMARLAETIKARGARAVIQLNHAGAKAWPFEPGTLGTAPSHIACRPGIRPATATKKDIQDLVLAFVNSAVRARSAGFDGVEIHGAHLYLLSQFISPLTNERTDEYGGTVENRAALAMQIIREVRETLGPYPIFFRFNVLENLDGGQTVDQALTVGQLAAGAGADVLDLSLAVRGSWTKEGDTRVVMTTSAYGGEDDTRGVTELARRFKNRCGLPVIAVGRLGSGPAVRRALSAGADMAAIGRQMICDPGTAQKILAGKEEDILECEACMACFAALGKGKPLQCKQNKNLPD